MAKAVKSVGKAVGIGGSAKDAWKNVGKDVGNFFDVEDGKGFSFGRVVRSFGTNAKSLGKFSRRLGEWAQFKKGPMPGMKPRDPPPDPRIAQEAAAEEARRRARRFGRAMLLTSERQGGDSLGL
jgi:hypothetical protein